MLVTGDATAAVEFKIRNGGSDVRGDQGRFAVRCGERHDDHLLHVGVGLQDRLYLPQFDAEAAHLDLVIDPAEVREAGVLDAHAVTGPGPGSSVTAFLRWICSRMCRSWRTATC
jgi:hypothetical protein